MIGGWQISPDILKTEQIRLDVLKVILYGTFTVLNSRELVSNVPLNSDCMRAEPHVKMTNSLP